MSKMSLSFETKDKLCEKLINGSSTAIVLKHKFIAISFECHDATSFEKQYKLYEITCWDQNHQRFLLLLLCLTDAKINYTHLTLFEFEHFSRINRILNVR